MMTQTPFRVSDTYELQKRTDNMSGLLILIAIVAIIVLGFGFFVKAVGFLIWVGIVLLIVAVIGWLLRSISGRRTT